MTSTPTASPTQKRTHPGKGASKRLKAYSTPTKSAGDERGPGITTAMKSVSCRSVCRPASAAAPAQRLGDRRVTHGQNERREHAHAERHIANHDVGDEDRREHHRRVDPSAEQHPDDGERGLRVPRRDVERPERIDVAHPVEQEVARREHRGVAQIAQPFHARVRSSTYGLVRMANAGIAA